MAHFSGRASLLVALLAVAIPARQAFGRDAALARADSLRLTGRYAGARAAYASLAGAHPAEAALGLARCLAAVGEVEKAIETLAAAAAKHTGDAGLEAELAQLEFERGRHEAAQKHVDAALALDPDQCGARFLAAELHRVAGRLEEADDAYRWLVRYYNRTRDSIADPEKLLWIGRGSAEYARWNRNASQFSFLVNTLYPRARALDRRFWPAHLEAARLFIEKYNPVDAGVELDSALAINPGAAELHATSAAIALERGAFDSARAGIDRALALDPRLKVAHRLRADLELSVFGPAGAVAILERARALDPTDEATLGRLAAACGAVDGLGDTVPGSRMRSVIEEAVRRNPHCGEFFLALAGALDRLRKYPHAARWYEEARRRMPQLFAVSGQLGMVWMRLGDETRAAELLGEASRSDPFNARVKNTLGVLDLLRGYGTIETEHFVIRHDRGRDSLLAKYASRHLEEVVYPEITARLGFRPTGKSLIEIFSSARGTSGQGWFSARMAGLPFIGTVAGCAGKMVGMVSPGDVRGGFDWARVLRHEFVHVVNLQQTDFNIPHWYTEGLAVWNEDAPRPPEWDVILARRAADGRLFTLDNLNLGFLRPVTSDDWPLSYCQAELYVQCLAESYGKGANAKLIDAYAENLDTPRALERCFGIRPERLDAELRKSAERIAAGVTPGERAARPRATATMQGVGRDSADADALARLARAALRGGDLSEAERLFRSGAERFPHSSAWPKGLAEVYEAARDTAKLEAALARLCDMEERDAEPRERMARLTMARGDTATAAKWAERTIHIDVMSAEAHAILAETSAAGGGYERAVEEYETAIRLGSKRRDLLLGLARACARTHRGERARDALRDLLETDPEYPGARELLETLR